MGAIACIAIGVAIIVAGLLVYIVKPLSQVKSQPEDHEHIWEPWEEIEGTGQIHNNGYSCTRTHAQRRTCTYCGLREYNMQEVRFR